MSLKQKMRMVYEENASLSAAGIEYTGRVKNLEEAVDEMELNGMTLSRELKLSEEKVGQPESMYKLPRQTTEQGLDSAVREAGISSRNVE